LRPNGKLILSGILNNQSSEVINYFYPDINLSIAGESEDWVLLYGET
jgi:ribosomal protein L11 methylase PrmA